MSKGSQYRPVDKAKFDENFDRIFGKRELSLSKREDYEDTVEQNQEQQRPFIRWDQVSHDFTV